MDIQTLRIVGMYKSPTGYGRVVRELARELVDQGISIELRDLDSQRYPRHPLSHEEEIFTSLSRSVNADLTLHVCPPTYVVLDQATKNINYTMFESTRIPSNWVSISRTVCRTIVPTESSRQSWIQSGVPRQTIDVVPMGVNPAHFNTSIEPLPLRYKGKQLLSSYRTRFLNISEFAPRKNIKGLLRTWLLATERGDDTALILKLSFYWSTMAQFQELTQVVEQEAGKRFRDAAPVLLMTNSLSQDDMSRLHAAATHYISMSYGEGWDLPMMEAGASGKTLIAPDHSAYRAYLDPSIAHLIPSRLVPSSMPKEAEVPVLPRTCWWKPDEEYAARLLRAIVDGREDDRDSARMRILSDFTWRQAATKLRQALSSSLER